MIFQVDSSFANDNHNQVNDDDFADRLDCYIMILNGAAAYQD